MTDTRPNILFFFADDQRFDTLAALGNPDIHTPNLDELVGRGMAFRNACIMGGNSGAVCMPSRAMLHSGRTLWHIEREGQSIPPEHTTLGEHLRANGYRTFGTGKWHNGSESYLRSFSDGAKIFFGGMNDHWNVPACDHPGDGEFPEPRRLNQRWGQHLHYHNATYNTIEAGYHSTDLFCDVTAEWIRNYSADNPFFAYVSFMAPHDPREMPSKYLNMYDIEDITLPPNFMPEHPFDTGALRIRDELLADFPRTEEEVRKHILEYYAMISHIDDRLGDVIQALKDRGVYDETIIVFAGDNGLAVGQHGLMGKQNVYQHSVGVPLIFAGPGVPTDVTSDAFCYLIDIFPTLCDLCGLDTPETVEGLSLTETFTAPETSPRDWQIFAYTHLFRAARDERYKLIEHVLDGKRTTQLFDLQNDPWETENLVDRDDLAEVRERLGRAVRRWRDELDDPCDEFWQALDGE